MTEQEFILWLLIAFAGALFLMLLVVLHERASIKRIEWDEEINGDWPHIGDSK